MKIPHKMATRWSSSPWPPPGVGVVVAVVEELPEVVPVVQDSPVVVSLLPGAEVV